MEYLYMMRVLFRLLSVFVLAIGSIQQANSILIDMDISTIESSETFTAKKFINNTDSLNLYNFWVYKIDKPGKNEKKMTSANGEVIFTPLKKILAPDEFDYFKIIYNGPNDDQERYYRVVISENKSSGQNLVNKAKNLVFFPSISLDTYFIVRPRIINFKYSYNKHSNYLQNTGNTYFRVLLHKNCDVDDNSEPEMFYLLPNERSNHALLKQKSRKYLVFNNRYINISNCE